MQTLEVRPGCSLGIGEFSGYILLVPWKSFAVSLHDYPASIILSEYPVSDTERFMSRTYMYVEFGPTQINKSTPVDSSVELH